MEGIDTSRNRTEDEERAVLIGFISYIVAGILISVPNLLTCLIVVTSSQLRHKKEYVLVSGLATADLFNGLTYLLAGILRVNLISRGKAFILKSVWECMKKPWNLLWIWTQPFEHFMLLAITLDRLFSLADPVRYFTLSSRYSFSVISAAFGLAVVPGLLGVYLSYISTDTMAQHPAYCFTLEHALTPSFRLYFSTANTIALFTSVILYIPVLTLLKSWTHQIVENAFGEQQEQTKRVSSSVGICTLFTLLFILIPFCIRHFVHTVQARTILFLLHSINYTANFFIYAITLSDIRAAIYRFCCFCFCPRNTVRPVPPLVNKH